MSTPSIRSITPHELNDLSAGGSAPRLIDVRTPAEFREVHIPFATNIPLDRLDPAAVAAPPSEPIYLICLGGGRGKQACERLAAAGFANAFNVEGGTRAWEQAGFPVVRGKKTISLERQVRIAAGSIVLIGVVLSYFVHPYLIGLAAFVGAGLVFAGVTDICGMAHLLGRMPWNQVAK